MASTGYVVADIAALKAISSGVRSDGYSLIVHSVNSWFVFNASSTLTGDDISVVTPTSGTGRWIKSNGIAIQLAGSPITPAARVLNFNTGVTISSTNDIVTLDVTGTGGGGTIDWDTIDITEWDALQ